MKHVKNLSNMFFKMLLDRLRKHSLGWGGGGGGGVCTWGRYYAPDLKAPVFARSWKKIFCPLSVFDGTEKFLFLVIWYWSSLLYVPMLLRTEKNNLCKPRRPFSAGSRNTTHRFILCTAHELRLALYAYYSTGQALVCFSVSSNNIDGVSTMNEEVKDSKLFDNIRRLSASLSTENCLLCMELFGENNFSSFSDKLEHCKNHLCLGASKTISSEELRGSEKFYRTFRKCFPKTPFLVNTGQDFVMKTAEIKSETLEVDSGAQISSPVEFERCEACYTLHSPKCLWHNYRNEELCAPGFSRSVTSLRLEFFPFKFCANILKTFVNCSHKEMVFKNHSIPFVLSVAFHSFHWQTGECACSNIEILLPAHNILSVSIFYVEFFY